MGNERYISQTRLIRRPAAEVFEALSRFDRFTPVLADRLEGWQADEERCSFRAKGFTVRLRMVEREAPGLVKICSEEGSPLAFTLWIQLVEPAPADTRMRIVLELELNTVMRMMIGGKIQQAVDEIARQIAAGFDASTGGFPDGVATA